MRKLFYVWVIALSLSSVSRGEPQEERDVAAAVETLRQAIISGDRGALQAIAADELVYGHSSGKVQTKAEFVEEIASGKPIDYVTVDLSAQTIKLSGDTAIVRHIFSSQIVNAGTPGNLKIGNMLIWQKQHGQWRLLARQAYKI
jgi:ketosteroid isomerase-like protein